MNALKQLPRKNILIDPLILFERIKRLEEKLEEINNQEKHLKLNSSHGIEIIPYDKISYCKADSNYTLIYLVNGNSICIAKTLKFISGQLPPSFIRPHQSFIVNKKYVRRIQSRPHKGLLLSSGKVIPISRINKQLIENHF